jgi:cell division transport system permease protein
MAIMAFLAGLTLLMTLAGYRMSAGWQSDLSRTAVVQVYPENADESSQALDLAKQVLKAELPRAKIRPVSGEDAADLLRPWIGNADLPDDIPMPVLIRLKTSIAKSVDTESLKTAFAAAGLNVDIDDHSRWRRDIRRTWAAVRTGLLGIMLTVITASVAVASYATQSVLHSRKTIIKVLGHVGAPDMFVIRQFVTRFFWLGLKAAFVGSAGAFLFAIIFTLLRGATMPEFLGLPIIKLSDLISLAILAGLLASISAVTAGVTTVMKLRRDRRLS